MMSMARTVGRVSGRLRLAVAGAVVLTALTTATAAGSATRPNATAGPRSRFPIFVLDQGRFTRFDPPGPAEQQRNADNPVRINNRGQISGVYLQGDAQQGSAPAPLRFRGFLRDARGRYTTIRVPGATQTQARGINNRGQVVGEYTDTAGGFHGFLWDKGRVVTLDRGPADAVVCCSALDINDRGQVVAAYLNAAGNLKGVLLDRGRTTPIAAPGIASTLPTAINNRARIVGVTSAGPGQEPHGFLLRGGAGGPFTPIDVPGAPGTSPTGINDAGVIVGVYTNPNATPSPQPAATPMGGWPPGRPGLVPARAAAPAPRPPGSCRSGGATSRPSASWGATIPSPGRGATRRSQQTSRRLHLPRGSPGSIPPAPPTLPASPRPRPSASTTAAR